MANYQNGEPLTRLTDDPTDPPHIPEPTPVEPVVPPGREASDFSQAFSIQAAHTNWFVAMGGAQGIRIAFGESMDGTDATATAHVAIHLSAETAIKLYSTIGSIIRSAAQQRQAEMQQQLEQSLNVDQTPGPR